MFKTPVIQQQAPGNRFVRTLKEPAKIESVGVEMFDDFLIENEESPESRPEHPPQQEPRRIIIEGLGEIDGQEELFNFSKSLDDFMFKFSFGTQNLLNKTHGTEYDEVEIEPRPKTQPPLTTTTTSTTTTTTEGTEITTTALINTSTSPNPLDTNEVVVEDFFPAIPEALNNPENEYEKNNEEALIQVEEENDLIQSDASKSHNPPSLAQQLEDYLLVLPLQFRFLRKDSPILQN